MADPTLAEMVAELQRLFPSGPMRSPLAHLVIGSLTEIDRRLSALEDAYTGSTGPLRGEPVFDAPPE